MLRTWRRVVVALAACGFLAAPTSAGAVSSGAVSASAVSASAVSASAVSASAVSASAVSASAVSASAVSAGAVSYGLADSQGLFAHCRVGRASCCASGAKGTSSCAGGSPSITGYYDSPLFRSLTGASSRHRITEARFFVAYDAVQEWNGSTTSPGCRPSRASAQSWTDPSGRSHPAAASRDDLLASLIAARADGLTPVVSIVGYGSGSVPAWDQPAPDPSTIGGYWEYRCGVQGILDAVDELPSAERPHIWEPFNEPDAFSVYNGNPGATDKSCDVTLNGSVDGSAKAACDYVISSGLIHATAGHDSDTVLAGVFSHPSPGYLTHYGALLASQLAFSSLPSAWSVHDYLDVTGSYAGPVRPALEAFDRVLAADTAGAARELWVTEAATQLTDARDPGPCPASGPDPANTLGACVSGRASRQIAAAQGFLALPEAGRAVPITHLFWYQWQGASNWDSGLLDPSGRPRAPWCVLYGSGVCSGSSGAA